MIGINMLKLFTCVVGLGFISLGYLQVFTTQTLGSEIKSTGKALNQLSFCYGAILLVLSLVAYHLEKTKFKYQSFRQTIKIDFQDYFFRFIELFKAAFLSRTNVYFVLMMVITGAILRLYFLQQPMRYDEACTFNNFIGSDFISLFYYPSPNNHVFHSSIVKIQCLIFGSHPVSIRFPAFFFGLLIIPLTFILSKTFSPRIGVLATTGVALCPLLVLYSTNARGYTLFVFLTLLLVLCCVLFCEKPNFAGVVSISAIVSLGMFNIPVMLFPAVGFCLGVMAFFFFQQKTIYEILRYVFPIFSLSAIFTIILYTPVVIVSGGIETILFNRFVTSLTWTNFLQKVPSHMLATYQVFSRDIPSFACYLMAIIGTYGFCSLWKNKASKILPLFIWSLAFGTLLVFFLKRSIPFTRTWIYLVPFFFILIDYGFSSFIHSEKPKIIFCIALSIYFSGVLIHSNSVANYRDTGLSKEASAVADYLANRIKKHDAIQAIIVVDDPLYFYLGRNYGIDEQSIRLSPAKKRIFFVIDRHFKTISQLTKQPTIKLKDFGNISIYLQNIQRSAQQNK